ncbi:polysaccharide deacetylase family protein [Cryptosporidium muris RN66]|uniref:Polysaccharide deacetylase family protein n=1 Tax=Cryptosporidium muris (strain RN66) TaxID=441375 RepID=B6AI70_CRYMR|nr:polysaccharide deacetylase family protein [Cryptosporidium muris RN66]EEA07911.1 polysaccharide deacetylase family protein [Cryptosporidium muris RN66]|eukprot:XP_002142260.1 polysaccharide deacetylase family protein [Cryptosporidium muris RN66]
MGKYLSVRYFCTRSTSEPAVTSKSEISQDFNEQLTCILSDRYIAQTMSRSKSTSGNLISRAAWDTLNKSGSRWLLRSFIRFGKSSSITRFILSSMGLYVQDALWWFDTKLQMMALTIDDVPGMDPSTNDLILDLLKEFNVRCTFFVTEKNARYVSNSDKFLKRCIEEGHELGNHLAEDIPCNKLSLATFAQNLLECEHLISRFVPNHICINSISSMDSDSDIISTKFKWFRPPFGRLTRQQYDFVISRGYTVVMCDVYPNDVSLQSFPQFLAEFCTNHAAPGSIVCIHMPSNDFRAANLEVFRLLLPKITRRFECVTLSRLAQEVIKENISNSKDI